MTPNGPSPDVYARRRARLLERLDRAVVFLPPVTEAVYAHDVHYPYRQDTNIRYLCGFEEPAALILSRSGAQEDGFVLCVRPRDEEAAVWTGERAGIEGARQTYGADHAFPIDQTFEVLERCLKKAEVLWYGYPADAAVRARLLETVHRANAGRQREGRPRIVLREAEELLGELRWRKDPEEIALMRQAAAITVAAHRALLEEVRPGDTEHRVAARIEYLLRRGGCSGPAYGTIAAGGSAATILHYVRNNQVLREGDLLLIDAGGEFGGYAADVTRTFPVGKSFSASQAELYELVLAAQQAALDTVRPGVTHEQVHKAAVAVLAEGMIRLGLLEGTPEECIESESYKRFFMHGTSHWLGMDVHDAGEYRRGGTSRELEPGVVLTVEPGIYVAASAPAPERFRGIGIRIEDDVLVTDSGSEVLSADLPKERKEIEQIRTRALERPAAASG